MDLVLISDGPTPLVWKERLSGFAQHVCCVSAAVAASEELLAGPVRWDGCVVVQAQRSTNLMQLQIGKVAVPTLLITPWVTAAQALVTRLRWVRVITPPRNAAEPGRLSGLLALVSEVRSGAMVLGGAPTTRHTRRRQSGRRDVYGL